MKTNEEWGEKEWQRRLADDSYVKSTDQETGLLCMAAMVHNQFIGFSEYSRGRRLEQGRDGKASKKEMDSFLQNGAMTEGAANMMTHDKLKGFASGNFTGFGDVDADRTTAKPEFWENPAHSSAAPSPGAASCPRTPGHAAVGSDKGDKPASSPRALDTEFEPHIECLEKSTLLASAIAIAKVSVSKPIEKAKRVVLIAEEWGGAGYLDALKALKSRIECIENVTEMAEVNFKAWKVLQMKGSDSTLPLSRVAFNELVSFSELSGAVAKLSEGIATRVDLSRKVRDIEVMLEVIPVLKASLERVQKMVETATRSKDSQVVKSLKERDQAADKLRTRSAGLANLSDEAFKQNNVFSLDWGKTDHIGWTEVQPNADKDLDQPFWIPLCPSAVSIMECKAVRLNHVVYKARFTQDKSRKRDFQKFNDPNNEVRKMLLSIADPSSTVALSSESVIRVTAVHCFGYHSKMFYSGPDLCCAGTLRVTAAKSSERAVIAFPFCDAFNFVKSKKQGAASCDPKTSEIIEFMRMLNQDDLQNLPFKVHHGVFGSHSIVYQPPGWLMFEKSLGTIITGVIVSIMPATAETARNLNAMVALTHGISIKGDAKQNNCDAKQNKNDVNEQRTGELAAAVQLYHNVADECAKVIAAGEDKANEAAPLMGEGADAAEAGGAPTVGNSLPVAADEGNEAVDEGEEDGEEEVQEDPDNELDNDDDDRGSGGGGGEAASASRPAKPAAKPAAAKATGKPPASAKRLREKTEMWKEAPKGKQQRKSRGSREDATARA